MVNETVLHVLACIDPRFMVCNIHHVTVWPLCGFSLACDLAISASDELFDMALFTRDMSLALGSAGIMLFYIFILYRRSPRKTAG